MTKEKFLIIPIKNLYMNKQKYNKNTKTLFLYQLEKKSLGKHKKAKFPS